MMDALLIYISPGIVICAWLVPKDYLEILRGLTYLFLLVIAWPITMVVVHRDSQFRKIRERIEGPSNPEFGETKF